MDLNFECVMCGKCCHDLKLPLSVDEALLWLERGGDVQFLCELIPWPDEPGKDNLLAQHKRRRSFAALSGELPARVVVVIAAAFAGACPHLQADLSCGVYEERPNVCRIYPAEVNPFIELEAQRKACPPEAWAPDKPLLMSAHRIVDAQTAALIDKSRDADAADTRTKALACKHLGIDTAALANEGLAIHSPQREQVVAALRLAQNTNHKEAFVHNWKVASNRLETVETLKSINALAVFCPSKSAFEFQYLGFFPESA